MKFDWLPVTVIVAVTLIWLSSFPWANPESTSMAKDIALAGISGVIGYMVKAATVGNEIEQLREENAQLKEQAFNNNSYESSEYIEGP